MTMNLAAEQEKRANQGGEAAQSFLAYKDNEEEEKLLLIKVERIDYACSHLSN